MAPPSLPLGQVARAKPALERGNSKRFAVHLRRFAIAIGDTLLGRKGLHMA
jgi:hypothetical protein